MSPDFRPHGPTSDSGPSPTQTRVPRTSWVCPRRVSHPGPLFHGLGWFPKQRTETGSKIPPTYSTSKIYSVERVVWTREVRSLPRTHLTPLHPPFFWSRPPLCLLYLSFPSDLLRPLPSRPSPRSTCHPPVLNLLSPKTDTGPRTTRRTGLPLTSAPPSSPISYSSQTCTTSTPGVPYNLQTTGRRRGTVTG